MKKFLAIFALLLGAATGSYSGEWNGAGSTSGSGFTAGQDVTAGAGTFDHVKTTGSAGVEVATGAFSVGGSTIDARGGTVKLASTTVTGTLTVLGTAPSLTATGAKFTNDVEIASASLTMDGINSAATPFSIGGSSLALKGASGNLGVGTASPLAKLSVVGNSSFSQPATFLSSVTVGGASENYLGVGDDTQYATNGQSGLKVTDYSDSQLYIDHKTGSGGAAYFRSGAGAEAGSARTWMTVNTGTAKVSISAGPLALYSRTIAQLLAITPAATGEMYFCNNCSPLKVVVSTGTGAGNFADAIGGAFQ